MLSFVFLLNPDHKPSEKAKEQEWQAGFEAMGSDPDVNNVEYMLFAAQEVVFNGENMVDLLDR